MVKHIFDKTGLKFIRNEEAHPVCGQDYCEVCGDCLACDWDIDCMGAGARTSVQHSWVQYGENNGK